MRRDANLSAAAAATAREVEVAHAMGNTVDRSAPKPIYPMAIEVDYGTELVGVVEAAVVALGPLIERLPSLLERADLTAAATVRELVQGAYRVFGTAITAQYMEAMARRTVQKLIAWERSYFVHQFQAATGADIPGLGAGRNITAYVSIFILENVSLIRTTAEEMIDQLEKDITREMANRAAKTDAAKPKRKPPATAKGIVENRVTKAKSKARFNARDQVGKASGRIAAQMQMDVGIKEFMWLSRRDDRVRPLHRKLDGKTFRYPKGHRTEGMPGEPPGCRCFPVPMFNGGVVINVGKRAVPQPPKRTRKAPSSRRARAR